MCWQTNIKRNTVFFNVQICRVFYFRRTLREKGEQQQKKTTEDITSVENQPIEEINNYTAHKIYNDI